MGKIYSYLKTRKNIHTRNENNLRRFLEAIVWIARSGASWRMLPKTYGNWNVIYQRFAYWKQLRIWQKLFEHFSQDADREYLMLDSTILRAHACAAGAIKKNTELKKLKPWDAPEEASPPKSTASAMPLGTP